jgi:hypothetical protein
VLTLVAHEAVIAATALFAQDEVAPPAPPTTFKAQEAVPNKLPVMPTEADIVPTTSNST